MIELGKILYGRSSLEIKSVGKKVNDTGIAGLFTSRHRGGVSGAPKMSSVAILFDLLFDDPGALAVYESTIGGMVYCEICGAEYLFDGDTVYTQSEKEYRYRHSLIPSVLYELSSHGSNDELKNLFSSIVFEYEADGKIDPNTVFAFCDSYYYGFAKDKKQLEEGAIDMEEVKAAFRSGSMQRIPLFSDLDAQLTTSPLEKEVGKKEEKKRRIKSKSKTSFLDECKEGKFKLPFSWPEKLQGYIVSMDFLNTFETTPEFEEIVKKISFRAGKILERMEAGLTGAEAIGKDALNIMLLGKPGTGKTTLAYALSAALQMPVCTTVHNKHTDEDEYEGKTKIVDGHPEFVETDALLFHQFGGIDICEEINLADPSVTMGGLGQKLEYPYIVKKNGYETVVRHPLNVIIATMNVGTNGSNPLNQALANRFKTPYILDDPTRDTFINILLKASGKSPEVCSWVYNAYDSVKTYLRSPDVNEEELCQNLSIRTCLGCIENMEEGQTPRRALINSIVGAIAVVDVELARKVQKECIEVLPNPTF